MSDRLGRRKPLAVLGYGLAAVSKPLFPLATSTAWVLVARFVDRIGKGIRGAPRDALVADVTPAEVRGAAYGLRQSLDTVGALAGPLAAIVLMRLLSDNVRAVFWIATLPAMLAVGLLVLGVRESPRPLATTEGVALPPVHNLVRLGSAFWGVVAVSALFSLARFSEAFLVLRAHDVGIPFAFTPLALVVMSSAYACSAYPFGRLSDRFSRMRLLAAGMGVLILANVVLAVGRQATAILLGATLWGVHLGLTQGLLAAMVADTAPPDRRGAAFGVFHFVSGVAALLASLLAGVLWVWYGPWLTFVGSAGFSALSLVGLGVWHVLLRRSRSAPLG